MTKRGTRLGWIGLALAGSLSVSAVFAQVEENRWSRAAVVSQKGRFVLGVGFVYARFDTNVKQTDKNSGRSVFVDAEGSLGLPEMDAVPALYGAYGFSNRHAISFSYFQIRREVQFIDQQIEFEGVHIDGSAELSDRTRFYNLSYRYTLFQDERSSVRLSFGLYGLDLKYALAATGQVTIDGELQDEGSLDVEATLFAPLPVIGFDFWFAFTPRWSLNPRILFVGGKYDGTSAGVLSTTILTRYQFNRHLGMLFGINYFGADVDIDKDETRTEVEYGYAGAFIGLHVVF